MRRIAHWSVPGSLFFAFLSSAGSEPAYAADDAARASRAEVAFWESVRDSKEPSEFEAYLKAFPQGRFVPLATIRLKKLRDGTSERKMVVPPPAASPAERAPARAPTWAEMQGDVPRAPAAKARGWIGAEVRPINEQRARELGLAAASGAEVVSLVSFGPAAASGLKPGDVVLSAAGEPLVDHAHLVRLISATAPSSSAELVIRRGAERLTLKLTVGNYFEDQWVAAHRNEPLGMVNLGSLYADGGLVDKNVPEAKKWLERAANAGSALAMRTIAYRYQTGTGFEQNDREAHSWYSRAAAAGDAEAMFGLGLLYHRARGVEQDSRKAVQWYERAAALNHPGAMQNYALALQSGDGATKNVALALEYFHRAAKLGQPEAFAALALAHYEGRDTRKDLPEALRWFREAAQRGHNEGYLGIAKMYERGEGGLVRDRAEAIKNYRKAAELNHPSALERLKALKATPHDPAEVQKLLTGLGFDPGPGRKLGDAIRKFQQSRGLPVDGAASLRLVGQLRDAMKKKEMETAAAAGAKTAKPALASDRAAPPPDLGSLKDLEKLDTPQ